MSQLISIIIPCFNQSIWLAETLESVYKQTYVHWECLIVNDGSTDKTEEVAKNWAVKDDRFIYITQPNLGVSVARNTGITLSKGSIVLCLDADDLISKDYIQLAIAAFLQNPSLSLVYSEAEKFGEKRGKWILPEYSLQRMAESNIIFNAAFFKKEDWKRVGGYDEKMKEGLEDWEFWIHILKNGAKVYQIPKVCFFYRINNQSRNRSIIFNNYKILYEYISKKHIDFFIKNIGTYPELVKKMNKMKREFEALKYSRKNALKVIFNTLIFRKRKG
ncbi:MAG: glycosyltransferase [Algibacter sp.]|uniref:glycosyltransferase family 2 protein n=1 Tax=Algibacter sp. TaxID=1872428 RepID=UPI00329A2E83